VKRDALFNQQRAPGTADARRRDHDERSNSGQREHHHQPIHNDHID
jgi:hypothetical protein